MKIILQNMKIILRKHTTKLVHYKHSLTNSHIKSTLSLAQNICSNIVPVSLLRLSLRIRAAVLKARWVPADVAGIIQCDSCILFKLGRCDWSLLQHHCWRREDQPVLILHHIRILLAWMTYVLPPKLLSTYHACMEA